MALKLGLLELKARYHKPKNNVASRPTRVAYNLEATHTTPELSQR